MREDIVGFDALYASHLKAQRGVIWKDSVAWYSLHALEHTLRLSSELHAETYTPRPPITFTITRPKKRDILAVAYRDRVYQRSMNDNVIYPQMVSSFVIENGACQSGKGVDYERGLFKKYLRRYYINYGRDGYFLQIDIKKYYPSMSHDVALEMFKRRLDDETFCRVKSILAHQYGEGKGYNPGSQLVQIAGISFLDGIDHYIKEKLHIKCYVRYMDDMVLMCNDREYLEQCKKLISEELSKIGLEFHDKKTRILKISDGITFLGFDWKLTDSGKVLQLVKSDTVKEFKRSMNNLMKLYSRGERSRSCVENSYRTRMAYISKGNSYNLQKRLEKWYKERMCFYDSKKTRNVAEGKEGPGIPSSPERKNRKRH